MGAGSASKAAPVSKTSPAAPRKRLETGGNHYRSFALPELRVSESWVRVEGAVLLIDDDSREVRWVIGR